LETDAYPGFHPEGPQERAVCLPLQVQPAQPEQLHRMSGCCAPRRVAFVTLASDPLDSGGRLEGISRLVVKAGVPTMHACKI
jgi:hypothetical protein